MSDNSFKSQLPVAFHACERHYLNGDSHVIRPPEGFLPYSDVNSGWKKSLCSLYDPSPTDDRPIFQLDIGFSAPYRATGVSLSVERSKNASGGDDECDFTLLRILADSTDSSSGGPSAPVAVGSDDAIPHDNFDRHVWGDKGAVVGIFGGASTAYGLSHDLTFNKRYVNCLDHTDSKGTGRCTLRALRFIFRWNKTLSPSEIGRVGPGEIAKRFWFVVLRVLLLGAIPVIPRPRILVCPADSSTHLASDELFRQFEEYYASSCSERRTELIRAKEDEENVIGVQQIVSGISKRHPEWECVYQLLKSHKALTKAMLEEAAGIVVLMDVRSVSVEGFKRVLAAVRRLMGAWGDSRGEYWYPVHLGLFCSESDSSRACYETLMESEVFARCSFLPIRLHTDVGPEEKQAILQRIGSQMVISHYWRCVAPPNYLSKIGDIEFGSVLVVGALGVGRVSLIRFLSDRKLAEGEGHTHSRIPKLRKGIIKLARGEVESNFVTNSNHKAKDFGIVEGKRWEEFEPLGTNLRKKLDPNGRSWQYSTTESHAQVAGSVILVYDLTRIDETLPEAILWGEKLRLRNGYCRLDSMCSEMLSLGNANAIGKKLL